MSTQKPIQKLPQSFSDYHIINGERLHRDYMAGFQIADILRAVEREGMSAGGYMPDWLDWRDRLSPNKDLSNKLILDGLITSKTYEHLFDKIKEILLA